MSAEIVKYDADESTTAMSWVETRKEIHSLDMKNETHQEWFLAAMTGECIKLSDHLGEPIAVQHAVAHVVELADDKTGELNKSVRLVLIDKDGKLFQCVSAGAWKSLQALCTVFGPLPWAKPRLLVAKQRSLEKGRRMFFLEIYKKKAT